MLNLTNEQLSGINGGYGWADGIKDAATIAGMAAAIVACPPGSPQFMVAATAYMAYTGATFTQVMEQFVG